MSAWIARTIRLAVSLCCLLLLPAPPVGAAQAVQEAKQVLVLHSFHPGFPWTDEIMSGIQEAFHASSLRVSVDVEYLDLKRHHDTQYFYSVLDNILHYKFKKRTYDLILVSDNGALNFAMQHRGKLLKNTPMVFCGISCDNQALISETSQITGVRADPDYAGVIRQALQLHPGVKEMVVVGSIRDLTDRFNFQRLEGLSHELADRVRFSFWNDYPAERLQTELAGLGPGTLVLINGSIRDQFGNFLSFEEQVDLLRRATSLPLYSFWDVYLGKGIVGGPLLSARNQGHQAGLIALRVLEGEPMASIPVMQPPMDTPAFDFAQLKRLSIPLNRLPKEHHLVNTPPSSYQINKSQFWFAAVLLFGSLLLSSVLTRNIMSRKQAEELLRQSEQNYKQLSQQFQIILDGIPDGLTLISPDMKVVWSNNGAGNYFNKTLGSLPGEYCCKLLYNRTSLCENCPALSVFETKKSEEAVITTPDGRILEVKAFPVKDAQGEISHAIMLASDITEKSRLIEENMRNARLASLGELAAGVAHEINNPNALILLNAELLRKACIDAAPILTQHYEQHGEFMLAGMPYSEMRDELHHLFGEMFDGAERIKRIVNDLKDFARADGPVLFEVVNLNEAVRASIRLTGNAIKNATDRFTCDLAETLPPFLGNLQRIEQVVVNLLTNACQALPDKSRGINVSTYYDAERQASLIKVQDEGCGISKENLAHIMDPFFTTKRESGGTGLGLSVSQRIIRDYGGSLEYVSELNKGTTATIYLPIWQGEQTNA